MRVLIAGDSMVKYMKEYMASPIDDGISLDIVSYPGYGIDGLKNKFRNHAGYNVVMLHVGTNDCKFKPSQNFLFFKSLLNEVNKRNPGSKVLISPVLPRQPNKFHPFDRKAYEYLEMCNYNAILLNAMLQNYCQESKNLIFCKAIDNFDEWKGFLSRDGVHLNELGNKKLSE